MGLTDTIRNKVNSLFNFDSQQQSNQLKNKIDTLYGKQNTTTAPNINGYSNELSESDFAVKQKNGEYGTRNGITYGHFGMHTNSKGGIIITYLPIGKAVAVVPDRQQADKFVIEAEKSTKKYLLYLYKTENGEIAVGSDVNSFMNVIKNIQSDIEIFFVV